MKQVTIKIDARDLLFILQVPIIQALIGYRAIKKIAEQVVPQLGGTLSETNEKHPSYDFIRLHDTMTDEIKYMDDEDFK